jgi:transcriptional regulator with XRE-family HTH domain
MVREKLPDFLPAEVLERPDFISACTTRDLGSIFRIAMKWAGFTPSHLCRRCELSVSRVTDYARGRTVAQSLDVFTRVADGLHIPGSYFGFAARPWEQADIDPQVSEQGVISTNVGLQSHLTSAVEDDRLDRPILEYLTRTLAEHRRMEDQLGSRTMLPVVTTQYQILARLVRYAPSALHDAALSLSAQYSQFLAWMYHDQKDDNKARMFYSRAEAQAQEAGDPMMAACVLSMKAHLEWGDGNPLACVRFAQAAQWADRHISPAAQGMAAQMEARGLAILKDGSAADRKTHEATELLMRAAEHWEDEPPWLYFYEGPWVSLQTGSIQLDLGRPNQAIKLLTNALTELDPTYIRDAAWYQAILARSYLAANDIDQAAATAIATLPGAQVTNAAYAVEHLVTTGKKLNAIAPSAPMVQELVQALAG